MFGDRGSPDQKMILGACTHEAWLIQRAIARSHVENIIVPLEEKGMRVDIYAATYGLLR